MMRSLKSLPSRMLARSGARKLHVHIALRRSTVIVDDANQVHAGRCGTPPQRALRDVTDADERVAVEPEHAPNIGGDADLEGDALL